MEKIKLSQSVKTYAAGTVAAFVTLFVLSAAVFLYIAATRLDVVMTQAADQTYTYFIMIMYRFLVFVTVFVILPLSVKLFASKSDSQIDTSAKFIAGVILLMIVVTFFGGEYYCMKKYKDGELSTSKMFCKPTLETKIFENIISSHGEVPPVQCVIGE